MGVSIFFFVQLASVFRSRFLVLITSASPEDCPRHLPQWTCPCGLGGAH